MPKKKNVEVFYNRRIHDLFFGGTFLLALWPVYVFCTKFCESMQELFHYWFLCR